MHWTDLAQRDIVYLDRLVEENLSRLLELVRILGGEIVHLAVLGAVALHLGMAREIVNKAIGHILSLRNNFHALGQILANLGHEEGVVGATEDDGINLWVERHNLVDAFFHKVVGSWGVGFVVFNQWYPEGTGHT